MQVKNLNFYDVVLDFILMDSFEDLENPPTSIQNVVNNRWLNSSFKETVSGGLPFSQPFKFDEKWSELGRSIRLTYIFAYRMTSVETGLNL